MSAVNSKPVFRLRLRYVFSYLIMLIIPFLLYIITFAIATQSIRDYIRSSHLSALSQSQALVEEQLNQISSLALQMSNDSVLDEIYAELPPVSNATHLRFVDAISNFSNLLKSKDLIPASSCYVYLYRIDKVMLADTLYPAQVYHDFVLGFDSRNYNEWQQALSEYYPAGQIIQSGYSNSPLIENSIVWVQSLPQRYLKQPRATLVVHIDKATLASFFNMTGNNEGLTAYIEDENGELVASISDPESVNEYRKDISLKNTKDFFSTKIGGDKLLVSHTVSKQNGWRYVSIVPETRALERLYSFRRIAYISVAAICLLGLLAAGMLASRSAKPILRISDKLHELLPNENSDSLSKIESSVSKLVEDNQSLQKDLDNQRPFLKNNLMNCLFNGNCSSSDELISISYYAGVDLSFTGFIAVMMRFSVSDSQSLSMGHIKEISIQKVLLHKLIEDKLKYRMLFHETDYCTTGLLLDVEDFNEDYRTSLTEQLTNVFEEMSCQYNTDVFFAIGEPCIDSLDVWRSVEQAMQALEYSGVGNSIVWYRELYHEGDSYYYPLEVEQRLLNFAKAGDITSVNKLLDTIVDENENGHALSPYSSKELTREMRGTLRRLLMSYPTLEDLGTRLKELKVAALDEGFISTLRSMYAEVCEFITQNKKNSSVVLIEKIQAYIRSNYADSDLGLYKIATHFHLSEGYFSCFFKEAAGVNFTEYLEKTRLSKAESLLKSGNMTMDQIAQEVGYNSAQSFRRAFKKIYGISPTTLRN